MTNALAELEKEAQEIRARIEPKRQEIANDEQQLQRLEAAIEIMQGSVTISTSARAASPARRSGASEDAIVSFVRANPSASAKQIGPAVGQSGNSLSVKLGRMVSKGLLTKTGERANSRYSVA